jgi:signal transduction histidine kinase
MDISGRPVTVDGAIGRHETLVRRRGEVLAVITHDPALSQQRPLLDAAVATAGLALDNARLYAHLQRRLAELSASRQRISQAAYDERRRIRDNLHDGLQNHLHGTRVLVDSILYALARGQDGQPDVANAQVLAEKARTGLRDALRHFTDLMTGIYPAALREQGLADAIAGLVDITPIPVKCHFTPKAPWPRDAEVVAYFVIAEALANVQKHARATCAEIVLSSTAEAACVQISDDGVGAADRGGSGLRNLRDRVEAVGGRLDVDSPPGAGTCLRVEIPLEPLCVS